MTDLTNVIVTFGLNLSGAWGGVYVVKCVITRESR